MYIRHCTSSIVPIVVPLGSLYTHRPTAGQGATEQNSLQNRDSELLGAWWPRRVILYSGAEHFQYNYCSIPTFPSLEQQPPVCQDLLNREVSRSHTTTHHSRYDSSRRVISSSQRPLPDNTQHSQQTHPRPRRDSNPQGPAVFPLTFPKYVHTHRAESAI